ncbi:MAG TPA: response regulator [Candidatus Saccharimonadales bacterium]|nr:response regulator [Candidatus Saccharimonadales bacterium]
MVLVVEDDKPIGDVVVDAINDEAGYTAVRVGTATDALETLRTVPADLIVLDLQLPGMSGVELYDQLRDDERYRNVPVIFETGTMREHAHELRERGVAMYVKKPFDLNDLVSYVKRLAPPFAPLVRIAPRPAPGG